ncbi:hypothetical protein AAG906_019191 [Vitis piasezkii]
MTGAPNEDNNLKEAKEKPISQRNFMINGHNHSSHPITFHKLNQENYLQWSQSIKFFIYGHGKIRYLTRTWEAKNVMFMSWLINFIEPKISKTCMFVSIVKEI